MLLYIKLARSLIIPLNVSKRMFCAVKNITPISLAYNKIDGDPSLAPVIIAHGLFGNKTNWATIAKNLNENTKRTTIAVDLRNHGDSEHSSEHTYPHMAEDLRFTLTQLNLNKYSLLGHSMGGRTVMLLALMYPELIEKLVVADISPVTVSPQLRSIDKIFKAMEKVEFPKKVTRAACRRMVIEQLGRYIDSEDLKAFLATNITPMADGWAINVAALKENYEEIAGFPKIDNQFHGPTLFIAGDLSDFIPLDEHDGIYKIFPNASITYINDAGHWLHADNPKEFVRVTTEFLNS
ncbi:protein ABHD11-like isoform X2 [Agrilus planipennis]|uniref:sn-1-specific diacylglycerol lipase ABHD11 n=1 Tax=Agrilus planipennis TaxID=224129 RepID=A0A7F5RE03_AGRPL|nr:protein ABHD11-like isoform X2 [Agrilus planipennis]XP_025834198.1 protein ABHD11-like isoform X2 [Agrilus planipennis]